MTHVRPAVTDSLATLQVTGPSDTEAHRIWLGRTARIWENVLAHGAKGDGTTDDTAAIQAAIDAVTTGGVVFFPRVSSFYRITNEITINRAMTIAGPGDIRQVTSANGLFTVTASNVHFRDLTLTGPQAAAFSSPEKLIDAAGPSAAAAIENVTVQGCTMRQSTYGIHMKWVNDFRVSGNDIQNIVYAAVMHLSCLRGRIENNLIVDIAPGTAGNAYGISLTRDETDSLSTDPVSADITVTGNIIKDIPVWAAISLHAGDRITVVGNTTLNCKYGFDGSSADNSIGTPTFAMHDVNIVGNVFDAQISDGSYQAGIVFAGAFGGTGTPNDAATGSIVGNVVRWYGNQNPPGGVYGAIICADTEGIHIVGNRIEDPAWSGILLTRDNNGFNISGNTIIDPWTNDDPTAYGIFIDNDGFNSGFVSDNAEIRGSLTGKTHILDTGLHVSTGGSNNDTTVGTNYSEATGADFVSTTGSAVSFPGTLAIKSKAGAPTDADFATDRNNTIMVDSTNNRLYVRVGGTWRFAALT